MRGCPSQILAGGLLAGALVAAWPVLGPALVVGGVVQHVHERRRP